MYALQLHKTSQINDQNTDIVFANHLKWYSDGVKDLRFEHYDE